MLPVQVTPSDRLSWVRQEFGARRALYRGLAGATMAVAVAR